MKKLLGGTILSATLLFSCHPAVAFECENDPLKSELERMMCEETIEPPLPRPSLFEESDPWNAFFGADVDRIDQLEQRIDELERHIRNLRLARIKENGKCDLLDKIND